MAPTRFRTKIIDGLNRKLRTAETCRRHGFITKAGYALLCRHPGFFWQGFFLVLILVKKLHLAGLKTVAGTDDLEAISYGQLFENFRLLLKLRYSTAHVCSNRSIH